MAHFTLQQSLAAQQALRSALGLGEEVFPLPAFVGMISDEIDLMRQAGHDDAAVAALIRQASGQDITPEELRAHYVPAGQRHG